MTREPHPTRSRVDPLTAPNVLVRGRHGPFVANRNDLYIGHLSLPTASTANPRCSSRAHARLIFSVETDDAGVAGREGVHRGVPTRPEIWSRLGAVEPSPVQLYAVQCRSLHAAQRNYPFFLRLRPKCMIGDREHGRLRFHCSTAFD